MIPASKQKRNRLIALSFASVLLLLIYGPLASWFHVADRVIYDQFATYLPNKPLADAVIVSIDPAKINGENIIDLHGELVDKLKRAGVARIILANPPPIESEDRLRRWQARGRRIRSTARGQANAYLRTDRARARQLREPQRICRHHHRPRRRVAPIAALEIERWRNVPVARTGNCIR